MDITSDDEFSLPSSFEPGSDDEFELEPEIEEQEPKPVPPKAKKPRTAPVAKTAKAVKKPDLLASDTRILEWFSRCEPEEYVMNASHATSSTNSLQTPSPPRGGTLDNLVETKSPQVTS